MQEAPSRIAAFARSEIPTALRESRSEIERFAQAAVRDVFDMVIERWMNKEQLREASHPPTVSDSGYVSDLSHDASHNQGSLAMVHVLGGSKIPDQFDALEKSLLATDTSDRIDTLDWLSWDPNEFGMLCADDTMFENK